MKIAYVTMVKDENDIIYYQLNYYKNIGFKDFYIMDNGSTDGTLELIKQFISENPNLKIHLEIDPTVDYWQYIRMNKLSNLAHSEGCDWILPVDADELLFHNESFTDFNIYDFLNNIDDGDYIKFHWWYYRPTDNDDENEKNTFLRINHRDNQQQSSQTKVLVKWKSGMEICQGNHNLHNEAQYKEINNLSYKISYAHFWKRSKEQIRKKIINLGEGYRNLQYLNTGHFDIYQMYLGAGDSYLESVLNQYKYEFPQQKFPFPNKCFL